MRRILIVAQTIDRNYVQQIQNAFGECIIDIITGSDLQAINVNWFKSPQHDPRSLKSRLVCWYRFLRYVKSWAKERKVGYDLIYGISNPPINSYIGLMLKKRFKAPFVYMNWDIYPQIIEKSISSPLVGIPCKLWRKWNIKNYPKIDRILTIGRQMAESIRNATIADICLSVVPLGVDTEKLKPIDKKNNEFIRKNGLNDRFIVLFSGKMGIGHNVELILEAASMLKDKKEIIFVFIGDGPKYKTIQEYIEKYDPENIRLYPWQGNDIYPHSIACGDVAIVTEEKAAEGLMLPSRVFSMMACGEAIIGICGKQDDLYYLVEENQIGKCITNDDVNDLVSSIMGLYENKELLTSIREKSREVVLKMYDSKVIEGMYRELFDELSIGTRGNI